MSKTSTSIGWVLVDERNVGGDPLDHDAFEVTDASPTASAATARRVRDIASTSGHTVESVRMTTSGNAASLRDALAECGFEDIVAVSLTAATRAWAMGAAHASGQKIAVCLFGRDSASLSVIDTSSGAVHATTTTVSRDSVGLIDWLNTAFSTNGSRPEALYVIGSRAKLDAIASPLGASLSMPVIATHDAQLALARGAVSSPTDVGHEHVAGHSRLAAHARNLTVAAAAAVLSVVALSAAGSSVPLAQSGSPQSPPPAPSGAGMLAGNAAPAAPVGQVAPQVPPRAAFSQTQEPPSAAAVAASQSASDGPAASAVPDAMPEPVEHIPEAHQDQHMPEAQPAVAPGPVAPTSPAPDAAPSPGDPLAGEATPLFGGLP